MLIHCKHSFKVNLRLIYGIYSSLRRLEIIAGHKSNYLFLLHARVCSTAIGLAIFILHLLDLLKVLIVGQDLTLF